jgi:hypothetical protein
VNELLGDSRTVSEVIFKNLTGSEAKPGCEKYLVHRFARGWFQRMEAQFALYNAGILSEEVWQMRCGYTKATLDNPVMRDSWEREKHNSMFTRVFIESIDNSFKPELSGFLGVGSLTKID